MFGLQVCERDSKCLIWQMNLSKQMAQVVLCSSVHPSFFSPPSPFLLSFVFGQIDLHSQKLKDWIRLHVKILDSTMNITLLYIDIYCITLLYSIFPVPVCVLVKM